MIGLLFVLLFQVQPPNPFTPAPPAQVVNETRVVNEVHVIPQPLDPEAVAEATVQSNKASLGLMVAPVPVAWANELLNLPDIWRRTPPEWTYDNAVIKDKSGLMWLVAVGIAVVAGIGFAILKMTGQHPSPGRFLFAAMLGATSLLWWRFGIDLLNETNGRINAPDLPSLIRTHLVLPANPIEQVAETALVIVYAIVAIMLIWSLVYRMVMIQILIAIGPLALLMYALPQTEGLAQRYMSQSVGLLFSQILIVLGLSLAQAMSLGNGIGGTLFAMMILLVIRRLPALLSSALDRGGRSMLGQLASMIAMKRFFK